MQVNAMVTLVLGADVYKYASGSEAGIYVRPFLPIVMAARVTGRRCTSRPALFGTSLWLESATLRTRCRADENVFWNTAMPQRRLQRLCSLRSWSLNTTNTG